MWGRRAFFTVRVPLSAIPEPLPAFDDTVFGESAGFEGHYTKVENGKRYSTHLGEVSGGRPENSDRGAFFIEKDPYSSDDDRPWYRWWEGQTVVFDAAAYDAWVNDRTLPRPQPIEKYDLDEAIVGAYRARRQWFNRYVHEFGYPENHPLRRLGDAAGWAKTTYGSVHGRYLYLTYSVKYFYRNRAENFSNEIARAVKTAKRAGIPVRVV